MAYRNLTDKQRELSDRMSDISDLCWFAWWMIGLEYQLWELVLLGPKQICYATPTIEEIANLKRLSDECGGWIVWRDTDESETFVPMDEWLEIYHRKIGASKP